MTKVESRVELSEFAGEEMRFFEGVDEEPFTEALERELIEKGWKASEIAELRAAGALYNRHRDSAVMPLEYDLPDHLLSAMSGEQPSVSLAGSRGTFAPVGRNELCPCGSGKKYKKCHGAT